jgi:beta-1,4-mannosyl-glycoprotein beta-1,4-N-acetylglucosaminyltransferase
MKIIDCFMFYNELKMLKFKLTELYDIIDYFVIIESKYTHVGNEKELYYENNKELFEDFSDKIIHIIHENNETLETKNAWSNENEQRFYGTKGIKQLNLEENDIIILSDLDEIIDKNIIKEIKENGLENEIYYLEQDMYYYNLNNKLKDYWYQSKVLNYQTYNKYIDNKELFNNIIRPEYNPDGKHTGHYSIIKKGGWHFSYFGNSKYIKNKIKQFAHQEFKHFGEVSDKEFEDKIKNNRDVFDRKDIEFENILIEDNNYLPINYKMLL